MTTFCDKQVFAIVRKIGLIYIIDVVSKFISFFSKKIRLIYMAGFILSKSNGKYLVNMILHGLIASIAIIILILQSAEKLFYHHQKEKTTKSLRIALGICMLLLIILAFLPIFTESETKQFLKPTKRLRLILMFLSCFFIIPTFVGIGMLWAYHKMTKYAALFYSFLWIWAIIHLGWAFFYLGLVMGS